MIEDSDPRLGIYDMRIDTTGMPEFLANKININICNKGGGGGQTQTTTSGIAPEFKPYITKVLSDVTSKYESDVAGGPDAIVAKMTPEQTAALDAQSKAANEAMTGTGEYDTSAARRRDIENLMGSSVGQSAAAGGLGSARSERAMMGAVADRSLELQKNRQATREGGIQSLGEVGTTKQQYEQQRLDAPDTAAQRYFGYLAGAPQQSTTTQSGGGGK
jgi:hypothetical protein